MVTGDDFGFSRGVNRAVIEAHERGVLTSASLMVTGEASAEAIALALAHPRLAVGLHLVVVGGRAALAPKDLPHLVDPEGIFPFGPVRAGLRYQFLPSARRELRKEIRAQLERFRRTGLRLSHVDGHLHMHLHPLVMRILTELASEFRIPAVRLPSEELGLALTLEKGFFPKKLLVSSIFALLRRNGVRQLSRAGIAFADRVYGLLVTGRVSEEYLLDLLPKISAPLTEIYCHPAVALPDEPEGSPAAGPEELAALLSPRVRGMIEASGLALTSYADAAAPQERRH